MMKKWAATIVLLAAAGVWGWQLLPGGAPSESELRQTGGITAEVMTTRARPQGVEVSCRVSNATARVASQVVLRVALVDAQGQTLAVNPLAGVSEVVASHAREARFMVRFSGPGTDARAQVEVSLVRWRE
ncbi:MAG TPA: hypothetical protein P5205_07410 [Candidatus Paceibacterota bacterium]|nr:hypothetical protein [Verrucomicrobiota bacterium]HSA10185.1 hypothetical protein [Candidatus Paceibacterota bacterium]